MMALISHCGAAMAQLTIRNLDDAVMQALKRKAVEAGVSTEEAARRCLASATGVDRIAAVERLRQTRKRVKVLADGEAPEQIIRRMRDERTQLLEDRLRDPQTL